MTFDDGSVGWYEAGWGPMMGEEACFVKDVIGPRGSVSIVSNGVNDRDAASANTGSPAPRRGLRLHFADLDGNGHFARQDANIHAPDEPDHQALCCREKEFFLRAIRADLGLSGRWRDAVNSLRILLAADRSYRAGHVVDLD